MRATPRVPSTSAVEQHDPEHNDENEQERGTVGLKAWWRRVRSEDEQEVETFEVPAPPTEQDVLAALNQVNATLQAQNAPPVVISRVVRIARSINQTLPRLRESGLGSEEGYAVVATATDYLPEAIQGYLRLPREWADTRPIDGHKTALLILIDQLELLAATMDKILDAANRADAQALIAHGRFLQARFGHAADGGDLSLETP
ncbi:hypothetical protein FXB39_07005 [Nocardioides sp. BGMRC 2183]|nr:hypothetical protein FXB39_07005 [Nocardioides sp. BGMRC 2183]